VKALCALILVLSSFSIPAQAQNASMEEAHYLDACCEPSMVPAQIVATEPTVEELSQTDHVTIEAKETSVEAHQPSDEGHSTRHDSKPTDEAIEQSTTSAQIVATEPTIEVLVDPVDEGDGITNTGRKDAAADVPVEALQRSDEPQSAKYSGSDGKLTGEAIEPSTMPAQTVATEPALEQPSEADRVTTIGATETKDVPVEALKPSGETQIAEHSTRSEGKLTDETIEQSTTPAQIIATESTVEMLVEAVEEGDEVTNTGRKDAAANAPVEAMQPSGETQIAEHSTWSDGKLTDETIEQRTTPAPTIEMLDDGSMRGDEVTNTVRKDAAADVPVEEDE
jgi:hypothetical protein